MNGHPVLTQNESNLLRSVNNQINTVERERSMPIASSRPLSLGFDISSVCNCKCVFCLAEGGRKRANDPDAFRTPDWLDHFESLLPFLDLGIFSSFEAVLNPRFDEFVMRLYRYRTPFQLFTNGKAVTPELSQFMLAHGLNSMYCSVHGATAKTYEGIMRGNRFSQTLENLMALKHHAAKLNPDFRLVLVFCAMRRNIGELSDFVDLAHRVGARGISVNYLLVTREGTGLEGEAMCFHPLEYDRAVSLAWQKAAGLGIELTHQPFFSTYQPGASAPCYRPWTNLSVSSEGSVQVCCGGSPVAGNMFGGDFFDLWNGEKFQQFRRTVNGPNPPAACKACSRGRENPWFVGAHLLYMKGWSAERIQARLKELGLVLPRLAVLTPEERAAA
jgi:MoaA/NifB/PqqE/SkfB family radical SAM enzyme